MSLAFSQVAAAVEAGPAVATWLATYLVHSTLIFAVVWLLQWRAGARVRDVLWKVSLVLPLLTTTARVAGVGSEVAPCWASLTDIGAELAIGVLDGSEPASPLLDPVPSETAGLQLPSSAASRSSARQAAVPLPVSGEADGRGHALFWVGAIALLLALARSVLPLIRIRSQLKSRRPLADGPVIDELVRLSSRAGVSRSVSVYELEGIASPMAAGVLRPAIYLPPQAAQLSTGMLRSLLAHELAHHARLDPLWNRLAHAMVGFMYIQPLHRIARRQIASAAELLADDQAIRWTDDSEGLASCLAEVAGWVRAGMHPAPGIPMVRAAARGALVERIERAFDRPREAGAPLRWPLTLVLAGASLAWLPSLSGERFDGAALDPASVPYLRAMDPSFAALDELQSRLDSLPRNTRELDELTARLQALQEQAEALRASVGSSHRPH